MDANIEAWLKLLHKPYTEDRKFVIHTGAAGMEIVNLELERENDRDYTTFLHDKNVITSDERDSILSMINSPDRENYMIARFVLESKTNKLYNITDKKHGINISGKES